MPVVRTALALALATMLIVSDSLAKPRKSEAPKPDPTRIVNESYAFRKEREPTMTEVEMAIYERVVPMVTARPEFALTLLESMVAEQEASPAFEFVLGNVYYEQRRFTEAEDRFKAAIDKFPSFLRAWDNLGVLYFTTERYVEAVPCFAKVLALGETEPRVFGLLGFCQLKAGNVLAAESSYLQAFSRDPDNPDWIEGLLSTYLDANDTARAEALLRQLVRLRPRESRFWLLLAGTLHTQGKGLEAVALLDAARTLGQLDPEGLAVLGDLCLEQRLFTEATRVYETLATANPSLGLTRLTSLARAHVAQGRTDEATRVMDELEQFAETDEAALIRQVRAEVLVAQKAWALAAVEFEAVLLADPLNADALLELGSIEEALGNDSRALIHYEAAARSSTHGYGANLRLANLLVRLRRFDQAVEVLDRVLALQRTPELVSFHARVSALASRPR